MFTLYRLRCHLCENVGSDIVTLCKHFLKIYAKQDGKKFKSIDKEAQVLLKNYPWPGNVRQLQNIIRNIVVLNNETSVTKEMIPAPINGAGGRSKVVTPIKRVEPVQETVAEPVSKPAPLTPEQMEASN